MKRQAAFASILLLSAALGCVTAKQRREEQQELARSIVKTSHAEAVQGCAFIMNLKPEARYGSPEAQTASLVIPKPGVEWVILEASGGYQLYSCKTATTEPQRAEAPKPAEAAPAAAAVTPPAPGAAPVAPAPIEAAAPMPPSARPAAGASSGESPKAGAPDPRVTNNPEAVRGCRFLASFTAYQPVSGFQRAVTEAGGDVGYVVASNRDGEVIGEAYRCGGP
jgi:hypothetical protein